MFLKNLWASSYQHCHVLQSPSGMRCYECYNKPNQREITEPVSALVEAYSICSHKNVNKKKNLLGLIF